MQNYVLWALIHSVRRCCLTYVDLKQGAHIVLDVVNREYMTEFFDLNYVVLCKKVFSIRVIRSSS